MYKVLSKVIVVSTIFILGCHRADAQLVLYQSNPLGLISKERLKLEYRFTSGHSIQVGAAFYYSFCPGTQVFAEYRYYAKHEGQTDFFYYGKTGYGSAEDNSSRKSNASGVFDYALIGGGLGLHIRMGKKSRFLFDLAGGLKTFKIFTPTTQFDDLGFFIITGPGSIMDINAHFGIRLSSK